MSGNNSTQQEECDSASLQSLITCTTKAGAVCVYTDNSTRPYTCTISGGIGLGASRGTITCENSTSAELCAEGDFCEHGNASHCPRGHYCPLGTGSPIVCPFSLLSCPQANAAYPIEGVVFGLLLIIFGAVLAAYWAFGRALIWNESNRKWDKVARVMSMRRYDAVNGLVLKHDQHVVVQTTGDIYQSMAARERTVLSGRWHSIADAEAVAAVRRFSVDLHAASMEDGDMMPQWLKCASAESVGSVGSAGSGGSARSTASALPALVPTILSPGINRKGPLVMEGGRRDKVTREGSRLLKNLQATMAHFDYEEVAVPLTVSFQHMHLSLKTSKVTVLSDICVSIKPFHVTAIMGPSGAGKTSLLCLLRGQAHYANISGALTVNGHYVESLERFRRRTAYVPQEDIVNDELSIDENILYSALLFNRRGYLRADECMPMVLRAERLLDISHIRTSVVGSASKRGISGGQKKRVSIGMELMKEAELFFLDEPTSGLDSASSMLVVNALHVLASKGVTVSTTIHQPRQEILNLMDNLVLLAPGGRLAYFGPIVDVHEHFSNLGYTCSPGTNIADFVMDTLCGFVPRDGEAEVQDVHETITEVCDWWRDNKYPGAALSMRFKDGVLRGTSTLSDLAVVSTGADPERAWRYHPVTQAAKTFCACFNRQAKTNYRTLDMVASTCGLLLVFGIIVAFLIGPVALDGTNASVSTFSAQMTSGALVFTLLVQAASLRLFSFDQLLRDREFCAGVPIAPYYLGKVLGNYCEACLYAFAFLVGYYPFLKARAPFISYWYMFFLLHLAVSGLVNLIAVAYPNSNRATFSVGCIVLLWSFGGISPSFKAMQDSMSVFAVIVNTLSPFRYSFEIEVINELQQYPAIWDTSSLYDKLGYAESEKSSCVGALVAYFVVANFCAYLCAELQQVSFKYGKSAEEKINVASNGRLFSVRMPSDFSSEIASASPNSLSSHNSDGGSDSDGTETPVPVADGERERRESTVSAESSTAAPRPSSILRNSSAFGASGQRRVVSADRAVHWPPQGVEAKLHDVDDVSSLTLTASWESQGHAAGASNGQRWALLSTAPEEDSPLSVNEVRVSPGPPGTEGSAGSALLLELTSLSPSRPDDTSSSVPAPTHL